LEKRSFLEKADSLLSKSDKVRKKYFFETHFITIKNPRPLPIYESLLESELVKHGLYVSSAKSSIETKPIDRLVPFSGSFNAKLVGFSRKDVWHINFWLLILSLFSIIYAIIIFFFAPTRWLLIPLICIFIIQASIALVYYAKALRKKGFQVKFYQIKPLIIIETVITGGVLVYAIALLIISSKYVLLGITLPIILSVTVILSSILIILRCFSTFKIRVLLRTQKESFLELLISYNGIIYQKLYNQKDNESNGFDKYHVLITPEMLEIKFEICVLEAKDEYTDTNLKLIEEIKKSIYRVLSCKPVELTNPETTEQTIETTYLKDDELRVFPLDDQIISESKKR